MNLVCAIDATSLTLSVALSVRALSILASRLSYANIYLEYCREVTWLRHRGFLAWHILVDVDCVCNPGAHPDNFFLNPSLFRFLPTWAQLSHIFGQKLVVLIALAFFTAGSITSSLCNNSAAKLSAYVDSLGPSLAGHVFVLLSALCSLLFALRDQARPVYYWGHVSIEP